MAKIIILGAGGIAMVAGEIARSQGLDVVGFLDDKPEKVGMDFCGATVLGSFEMLSDLRGTVPHVAVAFSDGRGRLRMTQRAVSYGFSLPNLVHPSAVVSPSASVGQGAIVMPGSIINAGARIGSSIILNTAASIDHECIIGCSVHIGPGARLSGLVTVGDCTWIGIGTTIRESVHIGHNVMVGAGSLVLKDIPDSVVAYGSPARVVRRNS